jgi:protein tyrosine/serine phosphatase
LEKNIVKIATMILSAFFLWNTASATEATPVPAPVAKDKVEIPTAESPKPQNDLSGLTNFAKVTDGLYRGAQPTAEGFAQLKKMGIKTVVSLRSMHSDRSLLEGTGLQYIRISCKPWHPEEEDVLKFFKIVLNPANQPVFVHCQHGADRTGMVIGVFRIMQQGWTVEKVFKEMDDFGRHPIFKDIAKYLKKFDPKKLKEKLEKTSEPKLDVIK